MYDLDYVSVSSVHGESLNNHQKLLISYFHIVDTEITNNECQQHLMPQYPYTTCAIMVYFNNDHTQTHAINFFHDE